MGNLEDKLKDKILDYEKLLAYGCIEKDKIYTYRKKYIKRLIDNSYVISVNK